MPLKRCLFIAVVECAIKKKLKTLSIETRVLKKLDFCFSIIKKKLKTLSIETSLKINSSFFKMSNIKKKLKTLSIETKLRSPLHILLGHKEKAQNIEHRNKSFTSLCPHSVSIKKKLRTLSIETNLNRLRLLTNNPI